MPITFDPNNRLKKPHEEATDIEVAVFFAKHIEHPCGKDGEAKEELRERYIEEAKKVMGKFENPDAREFLEIIIRIFEKRGQ